MPEEDKDTGRGPTHRSPVPEAPVPAANAASPAAMPASKGAEAAADAAADESELAGLRGRIAELEQQTEDWRDRWQRAVADFSNYRRRTEAEREQQAKLHNMVLVGELLPVLDSFERALSSIPRELAGFSWLSGIALVGHQLQYMLERQGLQAIEAEGARFDPHLHEAVMQEEGPGEQVVLAVLQKGYTYHDRVIRPTLVKVGPKLPDQNVRAEGGASQGATPPAAGEQPGPNAPSPTEPANRPTSTSDG